MTTIPTAERQDFTIEKGRTEIVLVTVEGVTDWTDILAKLQASYVIGTVPPDIVLGGTVYPEDNQVSFAFSFLSTNALTQSNLHYEVVLYKADKTFVRNSTYGDIRVKGVVRIDPTLT